jgi:uncharacterized protein (DUF1499 family)
MKHWPPAVFTGGYKIVAVSDDYLYMQFESGKIGYLDDLEFKFDDAKKLVAVRSVSYQKNCSLEKISLRCRLVDIWLRG